MATPKFVELESVEAWREYTFPGGEIVKIDDVAKVAVSESGTHRIETKTGRKHIVPVGWIHIEIDVDKWTF